MTGALFAVSTFVQLGKSDIPTSARPHGTALVPRCSWNWYTAFLALTMRPRTVRARNRPETGTHAIGSKGWKRTVPATVARAEIRSAISCSVSGGAFGSFSSCCLKVHVNPLFFDASVPVVVANLLDIWEAVRARKTQKIFKSHPLITLNLAAWSCLNSSANISAKSPGEGRGAIISTHIR